MSNWIDVVEGFKNFLKEEGCYDEFVEKTLDHHGYDKIEEYLLDTPVVDWIANAFYWSNQNQGYSKDQLKYWSKISGKFQVDFLGL
jgi:hypothetical protein